MFKFKINPLFLLVVVIFAIGGMFWQVIAAFSLVIIHEFAHVFMAVGSGYVVRKVEIFPFGGVAEYCGFLEMKPVSELMIAAAGPLVNLILALFFLYFERYMLFELSLLIGLFNLIPAFPLDGGRIFRSLLVKVVGFRRGTDLAVKTTKVLALGGLAVCGAAVITEQLSVIVLFLVFFVYGAAVREEKQYLYNFFSFLTARREFINKYRVKEVFVQVIQRSMYLKDVVSLIRPDKFNVYYILDQNFRVIDVIGEIALLDKFFSGPERKIRINDILKE
ncbi:MAG: M50 family metallopeptidase [Bacillota bacterium]